ncbi:MAG TPA: hypothetical protein VN857_07675, partial [Chthoniobacterales bacterium]|nr:hypothetical protein [Chthoniobacterales bacterium]
SEGGIFAEELTNKLQRGAPVRVAHLVKFFLNIHNELFPWSNFGAGQGWPGTRKRNRRNDLH